jgi:acyl carrier protein
MNEILETPVTDRSLRERLVGLVCSILGSHGAARPLAIDARLSDLGMSSVKMVNFMLAIEAEFDVTIPQSEITSENFESVASVERLVLKVASSARDI